MVACPETAVVGMEKKIYINNDMYNTWSLDACGGEDDGGVNSDYEGFFTFLF